MAQANQFRAEEVIGVGAWTAYQVLTNPAIWVLAAIALTYHIGQKIPATKIVKAAKANFAAATRAPATYARVLTSRPQTLRKKMRSAGLRKTT